MRAVLALLLLGIPALAQFGNGNAANPTGGVGSGAPCTSLASQAEAEAGTENTKCVTSLRVSQAIEALAGGATVNPAAIKAGIYCPATSASTTAYACVTANTSTLAAGQIVLLVLDETNTGNATLSVNSSTAKPILHKGGDQFAAGDLVDNDQWLLIYDGTNFIPLSEALSNNPGKLTLTCGTAPGTPSSDRVVTYCTSDVMGFKNDAGTVSTTVVPTTATSNQFLTHIDTAGAQTKAQPAFSNLSGAATAAQLPTAAQDGSIHYGGASAAGTDTYAATLSPVPAGYVTGAMYRFKADVANTGAATINFNSLGAKTIKKAAGGVTTDLATNDILANQMVDMVYDGTNMQMQSLLGNAPGGGSTPACTGFWPFGTGGAYAAVPFSGASDGFLPSVGVANYGVSLLFYNPIACTSTGVQFYIETVAGASKGLLIQLRPVALTTVTCTTVVLTSGGSPDINSTGWKSGAWDGGCTIPAGPVLMVMSSDATALRVGAWNSSGNGMAGRSSILSKYGGFSSAVSSGTAGSLAIATDLSGITWTADSTSNVPAFVLY